MDRRGITALIVTGLALFMTVLDNLVVTTALPSIRADLGADVERSAVVRERLHAHVRRAAADRGGARRPVRPAPRVHARPGPLHGGLGRRCARPSADGLIAARALQGVGGADRHAAHADPAGAGVPARPPRRRARHLVAASPASRSRSARSSAAPSSTASRGTGSSGSTSRSASSRSPSRAASSRRATARPGASTWAARRWPPSAWPGSCGASCAATTRLDSPQVVGALAVGVVGVAAFLVWETGSRRRCCRCGCSAPARFTATNLVSLAMYFGTFGSIFLLAQFLQTVQGYSAFEAGVRTLPWTIMPMFVAPIAGALSDRIGGRPLMAAGPGPAGDRAGLARVDHHRRRRLLEHHPAVHPRRHGHGAGVRARRQRR